MTLLNEEQQQRAVELMREYLAAPKNPEGDTPFERQTKRDREREKMIDETLKPVVAGFLAGKVSLADFKPKIDGLNKRHGYWGFKGIKGQMFFNLVVSRSSDEAECDQELKAAIAVPSNEDIARSRMRNFISYVKRIGEEWVAQGESKRGAPKIGSVPFFLSYFWQLQDRQTWPVYYTASVNAMGDLNLWTPTEDPAADYITYKHIHEELSELFTKRSGQPFGLYEVEHVFWFKVGNPFGGIKPLPPDQVEKIHVNKPGTATVAVPDDTVPITRLPESYVPPIVAILPRMSLGGDDLRAAAKASGTSVERAFEKHIDATFTILGYETKLLGQGQGRVPDGLAQDFDYSYAVLWDAKVRQNGYNMGTDDRTIREYIVTQSKLLKKRSLRNIYYAIISSGFADDFDDAVRTLKMETDVNEVCLIEAGALVEMVKAKLRDPHSITLGPDGIQRLFSTSGIVTADVVREVLST